MTIEELALDYHKTVEGEYGCPGQMCPGVERLVTFGDKCAAFGMARQQQQIRDLRLRWSGRNSYTKYTTPAAARLAIGELLADISAVVEPEALEYFRRPLTVQARQFIIGRPLPPGVNLCNSGDYSIRTDAQFHSNPVDGDYIVYPTKTTDADGGTVYPQVWRKADFEATFSPLPEAHS